jgi:hypothetical protein
MTHVGAYAPPVFLAQSRAAVVVPAGRVAGPPPVPSCAVPATRYIDPWKHRQLQFPVSEPMLRCKIHPPAGASVCWRTATSLMQTPTGLFWFAPLPVDCNLRIRPIIAIAEEAPWSIRLLPLLRCTRAVPPRGCPLGSPPPDAVPPRSPATGIQSGQKHHPIGSFMATGTDHDGGDALTTLRVFLSLTSRVMLGRALIRARKSGRDFAFSCTYT